MDKVDNEKTNTPIISVQQRIYGIIVHWVTIISAIIAMVAPVFILARPKNNFADPYKLFSAIFDGKNKDFIWQNAGAGFPGGHFYLKDMTMGDSIAQFGVAIGCSVALWALIPTIFLYIKSKDYVFAGICTFIALLIILAMTGILAVEA